MDILPPKTKEALLARVEALGGLTLAHIAKDFNLSVPADLRQSKGWVGELMEKALGADAGCLAKPDFRQLGIELKTLPVDNNGRVIESTYVSVVPLLNHWGLQWHQSEVYGKLAKILWLPIEADPAISLPQRRVGCGFLWSPNTVQEAILRQDWQELMDMVALGELEQISAKIGTYLQIRPKGANGKSLRWGVSASGEKILTLPRGFYLRRLFTQSLLDKYQFL